MSPDKKPAHMYPRTNGGWRFKATPDMRKAGIYSEELPDNFEQACKRSQTLNQDWADARKVDASMPPARGDIAWLIGRFEKDPEFYLSKSPRTQEEIDYAFALVNNTFGDIPVRYIERRDCRAFYRNIRADHQEWLTKNRPTYTDKERDNAANHKGRKVMKWFSRLLTFAMEEGVRDHNPAANMQLPGSTGRDAIWTSDEVKAVIKACIEGDPELGNPIPPRPSIALATQLAYDTAQPQQDILALQWSQYDGEGITVQQIKDRGGRRETKEIWIPLNKDSRVMLEATAKTSTYVIVSEETGQPYSDRNVFSRIFRRFRKRANIERRLTFQDLRTTAATEMGNRGATGAEIVSITGHSISSPALKNYLKPGREAARRGSSKRHGNNE